MKLWVFSILSGAGREIKNFFEGSFSDTKVTVMGFVAFSILCVLGDSLVSRWRSLSTKILNFSGELGI